MLFCLVLFFFVVVVDDGDVQDWDKPENIPDPDAKKPDDWDEEMDGEWEPPMVTNPDYKVGIAQFSSQIVSYTSPSSVNSFFKIG